MNTEQRPSAGLERVGPRPQGTLGRPQVEAPNQTPVISSKPRRSGPRRLSDVSFDEDEVLVEGSDAMLDGDRVLVTAVLERTCVCVDRAGDRRLASKNDLWVEADKLPIRCRGIG